MVQAIFFVRTATSMSGSLHFKRGAGGAKVDTSGKVCCIIGIMPSPPSNRPAAKPLILVVDDEPDVLAIVASTLSHNGYRTITAVDALAAERAVADTPDLAGILTD